MSDQDLIRELEYALLERDIRKGFQILDSHFPAASKVMPRGLDSIPLLLCVAQWGDLGYQNKFLADLFTARLASVDVSTLHLLDYLRFRIAQAYQLLATEFADGVVKVLELVLRVDDGILDNQLLFLVHFWKGRAHRKQGEYEQASTHILAARSAAQSANATKLVAVTKIHESWLAFQSTKRQYAFQLLDEAEAELLQTGHTLSLGNIESARGRFVRRAGEYARALKHFEAALHLYQMNNPDHPNAARALVNAAYVKRLMALEMQPRRGQASGAVHARSLAMAREAIALLGMAERIYSLHHHQGGAGSVLVNAAHIHLESGDIDQAATEAKRAFQLGESKRDVILMARAKSVESAVDLARSEEQLGEPADVALHANRAVDHAEVAMSLALQTQNKRLLCEVYIARGLAACSEFLQDMETAKDYASKAGALLSGYDRDLLYTHLRVLKSKVIEATHVDSQLRAWSDGQTGGKTFQELQEAFAELVIPKVWLQNEKNVTSVAKLLSVSPKKVRRVLRNTNKL